MMEAIFSFETSILSMLWLVVTANVVASSSILVTLTMEVLRSSETSVLTRTVGRHIQGDGILQAVR
jgi:hypothetical protein